MGSESKPGWNLTDHACRQCMGRVLAREDPDGGPAEHRCAECGITALGEAHALCWCGVEVKGHDHPFECFRNAIQTVSTPQQILVRERKIAG